MSVIAAGRTATISSNLARTAAAVSQFFPAFRTVYESPKRRDNFDTQFTETEPWVKESPMQTSTVGSVVVALLSSSAVCVPCTRQRYEAGVSRGRKFTATMGKKGAAVRNCASFILVEYISIEEAE